MSERHVALVTGGGGGIGTAVCEAIGRAGAAVLVAGRSRERLAAAAERVRQTGGRAEPLALDVTDRDSIAAAARRARELFGPVDWLVNNAGVVETAPLWRADDELYRLQMDVNFHGPRRVLDALLADMLETGYGRVVQIASSAALHGYSYIAAYAASKHALLGYSRSAAHDLAQKGVAVNVVCPHYVDSPMTDANVARMVEHTGRSAEDIRSFLARQNPGGVLVSPEEVAAATLALLTGERTGVVVELTGGACSEVQAGQPLVAGEARPS